MSGIPILRLPNLRQIFAANNTCLVSTNFIRSSPGCMILTRSISNESDFPLQELVRKSFKNGVRSYDLRLASNLEQEVFVMLQETRKVGDRTQPSRHIWMNLQGAETLRRKLSEFLTFIKKHRMDDRKRQKQIRSYVTTLVNSQLWEENFVFFEGRQSYWIRPMVKIGRGFLTPYIVQQPLGQLEERSPNMVHLIPIVGVQLLYDILKQALLELRKNDPHLYDYACKQSLMDEEHEDYDEDYYEFFEDDLYEEFEEPNESLSNAKLRHSELPKKDRPNAERIIVEYLEKALSDTKRSEIPYQPEVPPKTGMMSQPTIPKQQYDEVFEEFRDLRTSLIAEKSLLYRKYIADLTNLEKKLGPKRPQDHLLHAICTIKARLVREEQQLAKKYSEEMYELMNKRGMLG